MSTETIDLVDFGFSAPENTQEALTYLTIHQASGDRTLVLREEHSLLFGRDPACELMIDEPSVSRKHAKLMVIEGVAHLADLDSQNGTVLGDQRLLGRARLAAGDAFYIGGSTFIYHRPHALGTWKEHRFTGVIAVDPKTRMLCRQLESSARSELNVLLQGETGTGKEVAANALHIGSNRSRAPMVAVNCAALPETLVESELFGHERGAFSGAHASQMGLFEEADGGTIFLDEVGELPLVAQAKLLRVLETRRVSRLGDASRERHLDLRVIAASNRDLEEEVAAGRFRRDLYYRLAGAKIIIPPLRERRADLPVLAYSFLDEQRKKLAREPVSLDAAAMTLLLGHDWPGNVRELKNVMERCATGSERSVVCARELKTHLPNRNTVRSGPSVFRPIDEEVRALEKDRMSAALDATQGNQKRAAELISMPRRTFLTKLKAYGLERSK